MLNRTKETFLKDKLMPLLGSADPSATPRWGKMNFQQMIEHMSDSARIASGKDPKKLLTPEDKLETFRQFILSEAPFKENTKNRELGDEPLPVRHSSVKGSLEELRAEMNDFFAHYAPDPEKRVTNPFFGDMNYAEWVHLLHKHAVHHLKQFGVEV